MNSAFSDLFVGRKALIAMVHIPLCQGRPATMPVSGWTDWSTRSGGTSASCWMPG